MKNNILLVDDDEDIIEFLQYNLEKEGFDVITANGGTEALNKINNQVDLILLDIMMPNMDGLELSRMIKGDSRFSHLPIIAVTSLASEEDMQRGYEAGADEYHVKLDRDKLLSAAARYLKAAKATN